MSKGPRGVLYFMVESEWCRVLKSGGVDGEFEEEIT